MPKVERNVCASATLRVALVAALAVLIGCSPDQEDGREDGGTDLDGGAQDASVGDGSTGDASSADSPADVGGDQSADVTARDAGGDGGACSAGAVSPTPVATNLAANSDAVARGTTIYFISSQGAVNSILSVSKSGGALTTVVPPTTPIRGMAVDGLNVYFTTPGSVLKCPLTGCGANAPAVVASVQVNPTRIVTDGVNVYYSTDTQLMMCPVGGCGSSPAVFASFGNGNVDLALDAASLYWTETSGAVSSCPLTGCVGAPRVIASAQSSPRGISTDGTHVFWLSDVSGTLLACPVGGCGGSPTVLAESAGAGGSTFTDGRYVYWEDQVRLYRCAVDGCSSMPSLVGMGNPAGSFPHTFASDPTGFYWLAPGTVGDGAIMKCPPCGCGGAPRFAVPNPGATTDVVTDGTNVYWTDNGYLSNGQGPGALYVCSAANCAPSVALLYQGRVLSSPIVSGDYLYFSEGGYFNSPAAGLLRCRTASRCSAVEQIPLYSAVSRAVGGTLSGLPAGAAITLQNSGTDTVTLTANGAFSFSTKVAGGKPYSVSVLTQPNGQICGVAGGQGTIGFGDVASIAVNCSTNIFTIAGTTSGWIPGSLVVDGGFGQAITVSGTGTFAFPTPVLAGTSYGISVTTPQDPDLSCTLSGQSGVVAANVTNIGINCSLYGQHSGLSSDGTYLYWARDLNPQNGNFVQGSLTRVPLLGGASPSVLASNLVGVNVSSTAVDATYLYFTAWDAGTVNRIPVAGGTVTPIATGMAHPNSLLLNGTTLYWATDDHIYSLDLAVSAGIPRQVAANSSTSNPTYHAPPRRIATSSGLLYWIDGGVWRSSLLGSDAVLLASGSALGGGLAVADGQVFFAATVPGLMSVQQ